MRADIDATIAQLQSRRDLEHTTGPPCQGCGQLAPSRLTLAGEELCWACYDLRYAEIGRG